MSNLVIIDSSCWIKYFRNNDQVVAKNVENLIQEARACLCGIIEMEIIQGIKSKQQNLSIKYVFTALPYFEFQRIDFINSGNTIRELRLNGITVAPSDALIAELCIRNNLSLYTKDNDFNNFPKLKRYLD
jgi:predicted nucleic acid-binding protein